MFKAVSEAIHWVESQPRFKEKADLSYLKTALEKLDLNLDKIKKIHVAGTNGKGSTSAYLSYILLETGVKVGSFTSPYLTQFNERIRVNMIPISDVVLLEYINFMYHFNENLETKLSFFEIITLLSFKYFSDIKVDVMVIEVGIGGLLDSTNITSYDRSVITNIGMDHMKQLGDTKELIAAQKLGIIKSSKDILFSTVDFDLYDYFYKYTNKIGAQFHWINKKNVKVISEIPHVILYENTKYQILLGDYQINNALLAIETIKSLYPNISNEVIKNGIEKTKWPGRLEEILPHTYIDGAHNMHAIEALINSSRLLFENKKIGVLFSALGDKEFTQMLNALKKISSNMVVTSFVDFRYKDLSNLKNEGFNFIENPIEAYNYLKNSVLDVIIITGSIHFIGYIRKILINESK
ncbi:Folylpolyglutamate synthase [Alteracholeplasma palmae J233]|uniref:tetrahydrofolate synthase n=1 Tax=Alteracholeplasma palmae (strain ATCC 49389 / J233) TaxID=1318466 RepID=U4KL45_ALTPJ|nr:Mur ligase family protein [Alteracholeplasma palmae]CCV64477.1 Folylpolyglutamate synthase [Alteracholeplasma palmae J233]